MLEKYSNFYNSEKSNLWSLVLINDENWLLDKRIFQIRMMKHILQSMMAFDFKI